MAWAALGNAVAAVRAGSSARTIAEVTLPNVFLVGLMIVLATNERRWVHVLGLGFLLLVVLSAWLPQEIRERS
jgi:asparagine N-glycosylation enzyme membrane subunit Stt3